LLETAGEPLYFCLAEGVASEEARNLLRQNGREETAHAHRLKKAIEILTGEPYTIPTLDENPYGKPPAMGPVTPELLRGLIQAEFGGDKLYQTYAANEPNPEVAALLLQNGREETRHGQRVEQAIALLGGGTSVARLVSRSRLEETHPCPRESTGMFLPPRSSGGVALK